MQKTTKSRLVFLTAVSIGTIGAIGQAYLLWHELFNCYPYKVVNPVFYDTIANIGFYVAPSIATISGLFLGTKRFWLASVAPVFLCPIIFAFVFKLTSIYLTWGIAELIWSFDGKTNVTATQDFYIYSISLAIIGSAISIICSYPLFYFLREKKLT